MLNSSRNNVAQGSQRIHSIGIGCVLIVLLTAGTDKVTAQSRNFQPRFRGPARPDPIGEKPYSFYREYEDQEVLEWDFDRAAGWVPSAEIYPEAAMPNVLVTELSQDEVDWELAKLRYREGQCASCTVLLHELLMRLRAQEETPSFQIARIFRLLAMSLVAEERFDDAIDVHRQAIDYLQSTDDSSDWQLVDHRVALAHVQQLQQLPAIQRSEPSHLQRIFAELPIPLQPQDFEDIQQLRNRLKRAFGVRSEAYRQFLTLYMAYVPAMVGFNPPNYVAREIQLAAQELPDAARSLYGERHPQSWRALLVVARFYLMESMQPASSERPLQQLVAAASQWSERDDVAPYELSAARVFSVLDMLAGNFQRNNDRRGLDRVRLLVATFARTHHGLNSWQYRNAWFEYQYKYGDAGEFYRQRATRLCNQGDVFLVAAQNDQAIAQYEKALQEVEKEFLTSPHLMRLQILERMEQTYQRMATEAESSDEYQSSLRNLNEAARLRTLRLRTGHWHVIDLKREIDQVTKLAKLNSEDQKAAKDLRFLIMSMQGSMPSDGPTELFDVPQGVRKQDIEKMAAKLSTSLDADAPLLMDARLTIANFYEEQGSLDRSAAIYQELLLIAESKFGLLHPKCVEMRQRLAETHSKLGESETAERLRAEADALCARLRFRRQALYGEAPRPKLVESKATEERIQELQKAFRMCFEQDHLVDALRYADGQVKAVREIYGTKHLEFAIALTNLAAVQTQLGDYGSAKQTFHQLLETFEAANAKQTVEYASSLHNMAVLLERLEQDEEAIELLNQEVDILATRDELRTVNYAHTLGTMSSLLLRLNRLRDANQKLVEAVDLMKQVGAEDDPIHIQALHTLGFVALSLGAFERSTQLLTQVAKFWHTEQGEWGDQYAEALHDIGALHDAQNNPDEAQSHFHHSLAITRRNLKAASLVQSERQQIEMITALRRRLDSLLSLAVRSDLDAADVYRDVLIWKGAVLASRRNELNLTEEEAQQLERDLRGVGFHYRGVVPPGERERGSWVQELEESLKAEETARVKNLETHQLVIHRAIERDLTVDQLIQSVPENAALVDYYQYRHVKWGPQGKGWRDAELRLVAFLVTRKRGVQLVKLGPISTVDELTNQWRSRINDRYSDTSDELAQALRQSIWQPIEERLVDEEAMLIAPDGPLCLLPFAALPGKANGKYLIEERPITMIASVQLLASMQEPTADDSSLLVVGDVDYDNAAYATGDFYDPAIQPRRVSLPSWQRLPGTRNEMYAVRQVYEASFGNAACKLLPGRLASEETIRQHAENCRWIHIATHGFYADDLRPSYVSTLTPSETETPTSLAASWNLESIHPSLLTGLVLANANRAASSTSADGLLTARDVAELRLNRTELVVLSACETGLGELRRGEGLLSLQRAFHSAGARNVIAALWKVDDDVSADLMQNFYQNLWQKKMSKAEALRRAQIAVLNRKEHLPESEQRGATPAGHVATRRDGRLSPFYWAAFTLSGDGS